MKKLVREVPEKASVDDIAPRLASRWESEGVYKFDRADRVNAPVYSIDTPPPTVSGSLHVGHVFSYTHTDLIARFKRMSGFNVFYPMGFDDNGLPTERRVQNYYGVRPDLTQPYIEDYKPPFEGQTEGGKPIKASDQQPISRQNFVELCQKLSREDETKFKELWQNLGTSVDWSQTYQTIGEKARRVAQKAFLRNLARGEAYQMEAPGLWDVTFQTAVAQAELEAREYPGFYHRIAFHTPEGEDVWIETTRPELLISCVAVIAHPDDERYQKYFGKTFTSPVFGVEVPVLADAAAEMDKGSGIVMCCTFGDQTDIQWWRQFDLPLRAVIGRNGRLQTEGADWLTNDRVREIAQELNGKTAFSAREVMVEKLRERGELDGEPKATTRMTNFFEKGDKPLEIVTSRQWYIKNGGKDPELNEQLQARGDELEFVPDFMRVRYQNWVQGLNNDWLISRQRFFGVAFPVWYRLDADGEIDYTQILTADESRLPVDPTTDCPDGFSESERDIPGGFTAEKDVMDTWATSSLTPQIALNWEETGTDGELFDRLFPMDLRPQGQDIIRTWLFSTVVRAHLEAGSLPWKTAGISGWILDPDHKKMSKSKGNVVTPMNYIEQYGPDAVRYWAASARLGVDAAFDEGVIKIGRRLAMKLLNATKFALGILTREGAAEVVLEPSAVENPLDVSLLRSLNLTIEQATKSFNDMDHFHALEATERFFWNFCDDYIELAKARAYSGEKSAAATLSLALDTVIRLLAPFIPFAADEAWSWFNEESVHLSAWPEPIALTAEGESVVFEAAQAALIELRKVKSEAKVSQKTALTAVSIAAPKEQLTALKLAEADLKATCNIEGEIEFSEGEELKISAEVMTGE